MTAAAQPEDVGARPDPLVTRPVGWSVLRLGLPLSIGVASHALVNLVDLALVGVLGNDATASAHIATTVNFLPMILGNAVSVAALALLSQRLGARETTSARAFARRSTAFVFWLGLLVSVVTALPAASCVDSVGVEGTVRHDAIYYLVVSNLGCLPMFVLMQVTAVMRAAGEVAMPLLLLLGANALNIALDFALLFGWDALAIPSVGVVGAAYAAVASRAVFALVGWWWIRRPRHQLSIGGPTATGAAPAAPVAGALWRCAWPQVVQIGLRAWLVWWLTAIVQQRLGLSGTTALGITTRLDSMVWFSAIGFASAATTIGGRAVARGERGRARAAGLWAGGQALLFGAVLVGCFCYWGESLLLLFQPHADAAVLAAGMLYLSVAAWAQPFAACALGAMGGVHGAARMFPPLIVDLIGFGGLGMALHLGEALTIERVYLLLVGGAIAIAGMHLLFVAVGRWTSRPAGAMPVATLG